MFLCEITGRLSKLGEKCNKIVVAKRERAYTQWFKNEDTNKWEELEVGKGWEIVREVNASEAGVNAWNSLNEEERANLLKLSMSERRSLGL